MPVDIQTLFPSLVLCWTDFLCLPHLNTFSHLSSDSKFNWVNIFYLISPKGNILNSTKIAGLFWAKRLHNKSHTHSQHFNILHICKENNCQSSLKYNETSPSSHVWVLAFLFSCYIFLRKGKNIFFKTLLLIFMKNYVNIVCSFHICWE